MNKWARMLIDKRFRFSVMSKYGFYRWMPDECYIRRQFRYEMGKTVDLSNPKTFNEKLQWLKLHDRKSEYTQMVDKYEAKKYVANLIGQEHVIPTLGIYDRFENIDFSELPDQFVIKCTHDSGGLVICRDKRKFDVLRARKKIQKSLRTNYYWYGREWAYKQVTPRIIVEEYMEEECSAGLTDYKFFCFNGEPRLLYVSDGLENHQTAHISFYNMDGGELPFHRKDYLPRAKPLILPANFATMKVIAERIAKEISNPFVRIDLYSVQGAIFFSEITFCPCGGMLPFTPENYDRILGDMIDISGVERTVRKDESH